MTTPPSIPPHTELRMRQCGETVWNAWNTTLAHDPDITPKKAFTDGHYIAFAAGMRANAETTKFYEAKLRQQQRDLELAQWECRGLWIALAAAVVIGVLSR